jgi:glucose-6-phosphate 1-dehydrogenase
VAVEQVAPNPFAADVVEPLPAPATLVLFGATGDLAARKLLPAVYNLMAGSQLPDRFRLVAVARDDRDDEWFRKHVRESLQQFSRTEVDDGLWETLSPRLSVVQGNFDDQDTYHQLAAHLKQLDEQDGAPTRRLFYLAVAPSFFGKIATALAAAGLGQGADPPTSLLIEKPFGHDLASAQALNAEITAAFAEEQVFRIDHYLGKETVQNLLVFRFANGIFEPIWNRRYIDHVQITVAEDLGIGHRAGYYDRAGALRDVIQNHALQLVSLVAMEPPTTFDANPVRDEKVKALRSIAPLDPSVDAVRGQYTAGWIGGEQVPGYLDEDGVPPDSRTETSAAVRLTIDDWRWAGTPFYVRTGKRLARRNTEIAVVFKPVPHLPFRDLHKTGGVPPNELLLSVQPNEGATLRIAAKSPGTTMHVRPVEMEFQYGSAFLRESPEAYERLLHDALLGDATLFTRADEVEQAWRIVDPLLSAWAKDGGKPEAYEAGSDGPAGADQLLARDGRQWRAL